LAGIQEILTLLAIILGVIFIPRMMAGGRTKKTVKKKTFHLSGRMRLSIILSIVVPLTAALMFEPWKHNITAFIAVGILPVIAGWAAFWIMSGFKKSDKGQRDGRTEGGGKK
jgi:predicted Na+-dependent transporter